MAHMFTSLLHVQLFRRFAVLGMSAALLLPVAPAQAQLNSNRLPNLGDGAEVPLGVERRLGESIAREIYRDPDYLDDPVLGDYVQSIWQTLLASARQRGVRRTQSRGRNRSRRHSPRTFPGEREGVGV